MNTIPLVSVVIPTYNRPVYLNRCIESVLGQTYSNIEIIVIDDNNPNTVARTETEQVMSGYVDNLNIMYIQHEKNKNGSAARNTGWRASHGKYITFLDDDDVISEKKIEFQVNCLESLDKSWGMCYTGYRLIKENGKEQVSAEKLQGECYVAALMRTMFMGSGSNLFLRKSVVDEINGYDESFQRNQDIEFLARACERYKLAYIDEVLLTIYQEGERKKRTFEEIEGYTSHYLNKFGDKIDVLNEKDKNKVRSVISLERARVAFGHGEKRMMIKILRENDVSMIMVIKYLMYLFYRKITGKSFGFRG